jgi:pimeloyl-ACP methyl ester carboxylesterase
VAQQLATQHPARLGTLALFGSTPGQKHSHAPTWIPRIEQVGLKRFLADTISERFDESADPEHVAWFVEQAGSNDPNFIRRFVLHMCTHDFMDELCKVRAPTLIVAAGREQIGHASTYQQMRDRIAGSELREIDTSGHNICDGYAERCVGLLVDFLQRRA